MNRTTIVERELIKAILQGDYPAGSQMETERELAVNYQIGRPAIREVLQRLSHGGWLTLKKGHRAVVNDYWYGGNSTTIVDIIEYFDQVPDAFVLYFLEMRIALTPQYVKKAVKLNHPKVVGVLSEIDELPDLPEAFAFYDWKVQKELARLSENPIFSLVLNSFEPAFVKIAMKYFESSFRREASLSYYKKLLDAALKGDEQQAEKLALAMMEKSHALWENQLSPHEKIGVKFKFDDIQ
ncbi:fatty acid metabolism regulator protein [Sporosarcina newyorkensis 2681]|uniref:Fatty acid metabolism regulator protein n=1 Tax=Sporosarcina newyorkensis 2681 TaxID=1027292 RepID=F9DXM8_9BACL|nr:GntR family transcriptional regulator [Sporosarcina newyorkensis]EGQ20302.1 fatty acid metabolism regulator protein [Sporosarcina newyorkensis 2681]